MNSKRINRIIIISALIFAISLLSLSIAHEVHAFTGCEEDCQKCHTLSNQEVGVILNKIKAPEAKILKVQISPVKGLWEVSIDNKGQRALLYVDFSKKFLVAGSIIEVDAAIDKTKERLDELNKDKRINPASIPLKDALVLGSNAATKKVIVFTDPD